MDTDGGQSIVDLAPMNPKGLSCFDTHLLCLNGVWCFRNHVIRVCEFSENILNILIGGEYVQRLIVPYSTLGA